MSESLAIDVFWSFRSPWSFLATPRLFEWQQKYDLEVRFRPVYPIAIRTPDFFEQVNPLWFPYFGTDLRRVAEFLEIKLKWPVPDPVAGRRTDTGVDYSVPQPHIHGLTRLGILAEEAGRGIEFAHEVSSLIWQGTENWHEGEHLAQATERAGLDLAALDQMAISDVDRLEASIEANQAAHEASGHWGVPTFDFRGEPFFGQDRLDLLLWRLKQNGLAER